MDAHELDLSILLWERRRFLVDRLDAVIALFDQAVSARKSRA